METQIYFYKTSEGKWEPFSLPTKFAKDWRNFCCGIALCDPNDPNPYYDDYIRFIKNLNGEIVERSEIEP